ncbi:uncharacterized protein TRAVEDRAFT_17278 [Trametes versicolor FP-101664 SS1]|uniref:uncharacterized protein n=1 Tax=Trametes versicolor (strain FP-101664) TaxID=717944 RepID=UPI00046224D0|nr:uncharacterized protein TRAVEDRAFT_17278 [Trametes versicolor FP-101664 SS1]EIW62666.1 hypothetical protein TRAVEDRAFT_17278 [Trametes versicolor FP-101664 SS1]
MPTSSASQDLQHHSGFLPHLELPETQSSFARTSIFDNTEDSGDEDLEMYVSKSRTPGGLDVIQSAPATIQQIQKATHETLIRLKNTAYTNLHNKHQSLRQRYETLKERLQQESMKSVLWQKEAQCRVEECQHLRQENLACLALLSNKQEHVQARSMSVNPETTGPPSVDHAYETPPEQAYGIKYWEKDDWTAMTQNATARVRASNMVWTYMEDEHGDLIPASRFKSMLKQQYAVFHQLNKEKIAPPNWGNAHENARLYHRVTMCKMFPELAQGSAFWKVNQLATDYYSNFAASHVKGKGGVKREGDGDATALPPKPSKRAKTSTASTRDVLDSETPTSAATTLRPPVSAAGLPYPTPALTGSELPVAPRPSAPATVTALSTPTAVSSSTSAPGVPSVSSASLGPASTTSASATPASVSVASVASVASASVTVASVAAASASVASASITPGSVASASATSDDSTVPLSDVFDDQSAPDISAQSASTSPATAVPTPDAPVHAVLPAAESPAVSRARSRPNRVNPLSHSANITIRAPVPADPSLDKVPEVKASPAVPPSTISTPSNAKPKKSTALKTIRPHPTSVSARNICLIDYLKNHPDACKEDFDAHFVGLDSVSRKALEDRSKEAAKARKVARAGMGEEAEVDK